MINSAKFCDILRMCAHAFVGAIVLPVVFCAYANADDVTDSVEYKQRLIQELKDEISQIESENLRCKRMQNNWTVATAIGGVGVVATGTAAIIQANKLKNKEKASADKGTDKSADKGTDK